MRGRVGGTIAAPRYNRELLLNLALRSFVLRLGRKLLVESPSDFFSNAVLLWNRMILVHNRRKNGPQNKYNGEKIMASLTNNKNTLSLLILILAFLVYPT